MPLYEFRTEDGEVVELICSHRDVPAQVTAPSGRIATRILSIPAYTPGKWGDSGQNPYYSHALGRMVSGQREADRLAREKGYIPAAELGSPNVADQIIESRVEQAANRQLAETAQLETYDRIRAEGGERALDRHILHEVRNAS